MTTRLYREDVTRSVRRTNLVTNPRPSADTSGWRVSAGEAIALLPDPNDGLNAIEAVDSVGGGGLYVDPLTNFRPALHQFIAMGIEVKALDAETADEFRLRPTGYDGTSVVAQGTTDRPISTTSYNRVTIVAEVTAYATAGYVRMLQWPAGSSAPGNGFRFRRAVVAVAASAYEALAAVGDYFDGDTVDPTGLLAYEWTGTPNASTSRELAPDYSIEPTLVINYAQERPTGVIAHDTIIGGAPVIVRLPSRRTQRGTFEFYMSEESQALLLADMCDGRTNVVLVSDDVPEAPFTFCPTDNVRTAWNSGYTSWVVSVPYVKVTF